MKNIFFNKLNLLLVLAAFMMVACGEDDDPIIPVDPGGNEGEVNVQDGTFLTIAGEDPSSTAILLSEQVEAESFETQDRSGFIANYMWLEAGSYQVVTVEDKAITGTIGGVLSAVDDGAASDCDHNRIMVVSTEVDGPAFTVGTSGLYKVTHDQTLSEMVMYNIMDASIIGSATPNGWSSDSPMTMVGDATTDGVTWEISDVILRSGEWKIRFNCNWGINRRIDPAGSLNDVANGYQFFTNFGGTPNSLAAGGANIQQTEDGIYTINLEWTARDGFFLTTTRTGDAPVITFNPNDFQMAVIGDATANSWDADRNLFHKEDNGVHTWYGVVTFADTGNWKFRANDAWDFNLGGDLAALTSGGADLPTPGAGARYIALSTADEGDTWSASVTDMTWSVIGEGSPSMDWGVDTNMNADGFDSGITTYSVTGDFTTGGWKFRAGNDWPLNLGGDLSFLTVDGENIALSAAGTYTATLSFDGEVYSAKVE